MLAITRSSRTRFQQPGLQWPSFAVSLAISAALFLTAYAAMRSTRAWADATRSERLREPVIVQLPPLPATPLRPILPARPPAKPSAVRATSPAPPTTVPAALPEVTSPNSAPAIAPAVPPTAPLDTTGPGARVDKSLTAGTPARSDGSGRETRARAGAPVAPAGVAIHNSTLLNFDRDSAARKAMSDVPELAWTRDATPADKQMLAESRRGAELLYRRVGTAGNSADIHVPVGAGLNGVGSAGLGGGSISAPLLSSGPSAATRRKNAALDAEYQQRLRRLQDRATLMADSRRLDSLRRDSLAKAAATKPARPPSH